MSETNNTVDALSYIEELIGKLGEHTYIVSGAMICASILIIAFTYWYLSTSNATISSESIVHNIILENNKKSENQRDEEVSIMIYYIY